MSTIENREVMERDAEMIFKQITSSGGIDNYNDAQRLVVQLYVTDLTVSRSGISHALKLLEKHYNG